MAWFINPHERSVAAVQPTIKKTSTWSVLVGWLTGCRCQVDQASSPLIYAGTERPSASCSKRHMTLPLPLLGKASTKDTKRGAL